MKQKRFGAFLMAAVLLLCAGSAQALGNKMMGNIKYGVPVPYENLVYGYALNVHARFDMYGDAVMEYYLKQLDEEQDENDDYIYDARVWRSPDAKYLLEIQVKEPTYETFAQEIEKAPYYAEELLKRQEDTQKQQVKQLHDGILRDTPAGQMLEMAISYLTTADDDSTVPTTAVYYDFYANGYEYVFILTSFNGTYEDTQKLLDSIMQTVAIWQVAA